MRISSISTKCAYALLILVIVSFRSSGQILTTIAGSSVSGSSGDGGPATAAKLNFPIHLDTDPYGNIYIADAENNRVRKIAPTGIITTIAGTTSGFAGDGGPATAAKMNNPYGVKRDSIGNIYVAELFGCRIRKIDATGIITTIAGTGTPGYSGDGGPATAAKLHFPAGVCFDRSGNLYVAEVNNNRIRKINAAGIITTAAGIGSAGYSGDGGPATAAELDRPYDIQTDNNDNLIIADQHNNVIRKITPGGIISTLAGDGTYGGSGDGGPATAAQFRGPSGIAIDKCGNIFIADQANEKIRKISTDGIITTVAGTGYYGSSGDGGYATDAVLSAPQGVAVDDSGLIYYTDTDSNKVRKISCYTAPCPGTITAFTDSICVNDTLMLRSSTSIGSWRSSNTTIATVSGTGLVKALVSGLDTIMYIVTNACGSDTAYFQVKVRSYASCHLGIDIPNSGKNPILTISPNPSHGKFMCRLSSANTENAEVFFTNILGQKIKTFTLVPNTDTEIQLNVPPGIYFLYTVVDGQPLRQKAIIE